MRAFTAATRASRLALAQTELIIADLKRVWPDADIIVKTISTTGDQDKSTALWKLEGTGFFTSRIESALLRKDADFAVHSFKDLPTCSSEGLVLGALCKREYVEDVLISKLSISSIADLPYGAKVGTSSLRRRAQLKHLRPDIEAVTIRGNVETRIEKVDNGDVDAIIIARAGIERLGLSQRISYIFDPMDFLPAPAQGTLAVQVRSDDDETRRLIETLDDKNSRITSLAEREVLAIMEGGCHAPIGAYARLEGKKMILCGFICGLDGDRFIKSSIEGDAEDWRRLARQLADELLAGGGRNFLEELRP